VDARKFHHLDLQTPANGKWSDGTPLTSADFIYAYQRILAAQLGADYANMLYPMT
jgi:oligopeptide transport system substrate-binding protein